MKHLITNYTGGFPFDLDDYRFMEAGFNEDIISILKAYKYEAQGSSYGIPPPNSFIISGCEIIPVTYTPPGGPSVAGFGWTEGAVLIDGVIYKVNAQTTPSGLGFLSPLSAFYFDTSVVIDPAGTEDFKNGTSHNTYGIRTAVPTIHTIGLGVNQLVFDTFTPRFLANVWSGESQFRRIGTLGNPAYGPGFNNSFTAIPTLGFRKNQHNEVELRGFCECYGSGGQIIFTLPVGYRPKLVGGEEIHFPVKNIYLPGEMHIVYIMGDGRVGIAGSGTAPSMLIELSTVRFSTQ